MKIGIINDLPMLPSLNYLFSGLETIVEKHQTFRRPPEYLHASNVRREEMTKELILKSDVIVGTMDEMMLQTRERVGKHVPYVWFPFASVTRSFPDMRHNHQYFKSTDIIVCHCEAEVEITRKFFTNARLRYVPFIYDDSIFYPLEEASRQAVKAEMGFGPDDKILLYVGRIAVEKNVQTVLKIFSVVQNLIPNVHLVVVGRASESPFAEFGVFPLNLIGTLTKMYRTLGIPKEKIHFIDNKAPAELRNLYSAADAVFNLTLNHDENFGLAQVEAMGCGTPVVGTNWGGLKDTIIDGETGYKVSTFASSALGVKVDWWEGAHKLVSLLTAKESERLRFRRRSQEHVYGKFSLAPFTQAINSILAEAAELKEGESEQLELTPFAREFFGVCVPLLGRLPSYRLSAHTYDLYRQLIAPFTGSTQEGEADTNGHLSTGQTLCLANPVVINDDGSVSVDDLIYPIRLPLPEAHRERVLAALEAMREEPIIKVERLIGVYLSGHPTAIDALTWMLDAGLILKTLAGDGRVTLRDVGMKMSTPLYSVQRINPMAVDVVVVG